MILVVGATKRLGGTIARRLLADRRPVRVLVRPQSDYQSLVQAGAEPVIGDLKDPASLGSACDGIEAIITTANADNTIVVIPGANALVDATDVAAPTLAKGDIAVSQFEIPLPTINAFFKRARAGGATILNPAPATQFDAEMLDLVDILILNESELSFLTKAELRDTDDDARFIEAAGLLQTGKDKIVCVTLGRRGVLALIDGQPLIISGRAVRAVDTTGAGDCFVGAVAAQLAGGASIGDALDYANSAASICVQRMGAAPSMPSAVEVELAQKG